MSILDRLHEQLDRDVAEYLKFARSRGNGLSITLFVNKEGLVGEPKITIDTSRDRRVFDKVS